MRSSHWLASRVIGDPVRNSAGETLGNIKELIIDPANGKIDFAIVALELFSGGEDHFVAVPWNVLGLLAGRDYVLLDMDKNVLDRAAVFNAREWPDFSDLAWRNRVHSYFGVAEPVSRDRVVVEHHEYPAPRKEMSVFAKAFLFLVFLGLLGFAYLVGTRGWEQAKTDMLRSFSDVAYAMKETSGDAALAAKVKMALSLNKTIPAHNIHVDVDSGVVSLRGQVADDQTRAAAVKVAEDTPGVLQVRNELNVMSPGKVN